MLCILACLCMYSILFGPRAYVLTTYRSREDGYQA
jgi:hypothetical protein